MTSLFPFSLPGSDNVGETEREHLADGGLNDRHDGEPSVPPIVSIDSSAMRNGDLSSTPVARHSPTAGVPSCLPLSMRMMRYAPGMRTCPHCNSSLHSVSPPGKSRRDDVDENDDDLLDDSVIAKYDLDSLRRQNSAASPLVVAPMMQPIATNTSSLIVGRVIHEYTEACHFYGCGHRVNAGVLTTFRFSLPSLRVSGSFHDADMLALAEILLRYCNGPLRYIHRLDFSIAAKEGKLNGGRKGFRSHGALALSKVLQNTVYVQQVNLQRNRIGPFGSAAIFIACSSNPSIQHLVLRRCRVGERGGLTFAELIVPSSECGLMHIDLSSNYIGFTGCLAIEEALVRRAARSDMSPLTVNLEGNLVFQEIMNGVTHGLGVLLAFLGAAFLSRRVEGMSTRHSISCAVYSSALVVLYMSSTLYHSFFTMQNTKYIFEVFDKCAIYILIAGSYTPFLQIVLSHEPVYSVYLLAFIWVCCFLGICVEAFLPEWKRKQLFSLAMYLGLGWSAVVCLPEVARILPEGAMNLMVLGGVGYTVGVPFFVRNNNLDHALWHLFVLAGSIFHWCGIYIYVSRVP